MQELRQAIIDSFNKKIENGEIQAKIDKEIDKFVSEILGDILKSYSDFGKVIKDKISKELMDSTNNINFTKYNAILMESFKNRIDDVYISSALKNSENLLDKIFERPPENIKLSQLIEKFKDNYQEAAAENSEEDMSFHIEDKGWCYIVYFDNEGNKSECECEYKMFIDSHNRIISSIYHKDYSGTKILNPINGTFSGFESYIYSMMAYGTKIDIDEVDTNYRWSDC